jgi:hypothetical protein
MVDQLGLGEEPADELARGLLDVLEGAAPTAPRFPWERVVRLALLALVLWQGVSLVRQMRAWRRKGAPLHLRPSARVLAGLAFGLLISVGWLVAVPVLFGLPLTTLLALQPDLGLALVAGAVLGGTEAVLKAFLRSAEGARVAAAPPAARRAAA